MKKLVFAAFIAAFAMTACNSSKTEETKSPAETSAVETQSIGGGDIACVNSDKIFTECEFYTTEGVALQEKTQKAQQSWANKERNLQNEAAQLQEKMEKGLITSRDAQTQYEALQKKAANQQAGVQKEGQTLEEENFVFLNRMHDMLRRAVQEVNADKRYKLVVEVSALLDYDESLDISDAVLAKMNELYKKEKSAK